MTRGPRPRGLPGRAAGLSGRERSGLPAVLCERSFRGEAARTRHPGGLGIGLSIARDVARRHGFSLSIRRAEPVGLEVELAGPLAS